MLLEAVFHRPKMNWAYATDTHAVHIRIQTKKGDMNQVSLLHGDKYIWEKSSKVEPMECLVSDALFDYWEASVKLPLRRMRYGFKLESEGKTMWFTEKGFFEEMPADSWGLFEYPFLHAGEIFSAPSWVKDAVFYQIFPERFANGNVLNDPTEVEEWGGKPGRSNFFGGDLQGVMDHLDHLQELGVTAVYFTPIFEATTNHKYDTTDYLKIDPHFGNNELMKELVKAFHERGIKVVLDAVFNHCGNSFKPFVDVLEKGKDSAYADWFHVREWPLSVKEGVPTYDTFAFEPIMPKMNTENPEVKQYLLEVARYWVEDIGTDGWRLDVADEVDHAFWREFRTTVKKANPEAYILGEIWHDSLPWLQGDQFDSAMNYPFTDAVINFIAKGKLDAAGYSAEIGHQIASHTKSVTDAAFNVLDSHDTARLLFRCGENKDMMKAAVVLQFTYPGVPCVYYGDEIGLTGGDDPGCRPCMEWDKTKQDLTLFRFYQDIIRFRKEQPALRTGKLRFLLNEAGSQIIAFERELDGDRIAIAVNASEEAVTVQLPLAQGEWVDWQSADKIAHVSAKGNAKATLELPAYGFAILARKKEMV
ncbi:alpha-glycosidase [Gorillibacterium timonense]|uniref:alpha-glycosidase n=1 Tax=Gorillibacterium timonense TaxID=1689269 RepID=UPI00071D6429|nr:alpha-glycosidase [Gorillibacterium timonense]